MSKGESAGAGVKTDEIRLETAGGTDVIDLTQQLRDKLKESKMNTGTVAIFVVGSTAAVTTCEYEPGLVADIKDIFEKLIPRAKSYRHDATWGDANGFSHLRASLVGPSLVVPFEGGELRLGTWQQVVLIDFDNRPRTRRIALTFHGR